jgi:hypothetical protein
MLLVFLSSMCVERMAMTTPKKKRIAILHTHETLCRLEQETKKKKEKAFAAAISFLPLMC